MFHKYYRDLGKPAYVYILANRVRGTLYIGVTSDLVKRLYEHRNGLHQGFTTRYGVKRLVCFERHDEVEQAIARKKQLKGWRRPWKLELIETANSQWLDLGSSLGLEPLEE